MMNGELSGGCERVTLSDLYIGTVMCVIDVSR